MMPEYGEWKSLPHRTRWGAERQETGSWWPCRSQARSLGWDLWQAISVGREVMKAKESESFVSVIEKQRARAVKRQMKETRNWSWGCSQEQREMGEEEAPAHLWAGSRGMSDLQEVSAKLGGWQLGMEWKEIGKRNLVCVSSLKTPQTKGQRQMRRHCSGISWLFVS